MNKCDPQIFDVYRLNFKTYEMEMSAENPWTVSYWLTDHDGLLRGAFVTDGVYGCILFGKSENSVFYLLSNVGREKIVFCTFDLKNCTLSEILFECPEVEILKCFLLQKEKTV